MGNEYTRRAVAAAVLGTGIGTGLISPVAPYLDQFSPLSGAAWERASDRVGGTVQTPYGDATVTYDEWGVPTVAADTEAGGYYAVGYVQGVDRLFQMDLFSRRMRGTLSAVVGDQTLDSDRFHRRVGFTQAAEATWETVADSDAGTMVEAFTAGVNAARRRESTPLEYGLLGFEPSEWTPVDTMLIQKQISWGLTGSFETLRATRIADTLESDLFAELYPDRYDHDAPIIQPHHTNTTPNQDVELGASGSGTPVDRDRVRELERFEWPDWVGSNSWIVGGEYTDTGAPLLANDPHLTLSVPPIWYEQHLDFPDYTVHGVTLPGVPFVVIGENEHGAWGFTNANADVIDFYSYETTDNDRYRYRDYTRSFDTRTETIEVADGPDEEIEVRESVHGPIITRENQTVAMAWTGLSGTRTTQAVYEYAHTTGVDEFLAATERFDEPTQNLVYASRDGATLYCLTGQIPIRRTDGDPVPGNRVFDGSAAEGEWQGFEPYGQSSWEGFIPFDEKPQVQAVDYLGTANQRIVDSPQHYIAESYSDPFRGIRLYDRLETLLDNDAPITNADMEGLQRDTFDGRAARVTEPILEAASGTELEPFVEPFTSWDYHMRTDSVAALRFALFWEAYTEELYADAFDARGLDAGHWPTSWVTATLDADAAWFDAIDRTRASVIRDALDAARTRETDEGIETYGDLNVADIDHPFALEFLGYPEHAIAGASETLFNYHRDSPAGSSWRMVVPFTEPSTGILPGGNSGDYFDPHYKDQLGLWVSGQYRRLTPATGDPTLTFRSDSGD